ncbi:hypothetical protein HPB51_000500 [Rhipicephalus microplus]|uniref:EF-hand domain-containing protein n=1 Tax=Rhipicephalus microplus TaxID=6941 RepID=A0A9J6E4N1_RHIMP|nr:hypothetical protein HPB51_000500 [Rhipicephalus microplus]
MSFTKEDELNDAQVSELRDVFFKFDAERTGTVAFEHVDEILRTVGRIVTDPEFKKRVKSTVPADLEKKVQFPEFMDMVQKCTRAFSPQKDLHDAFRVFDRDGHGFITTAELRHVVTTLGERMTEEEADELIREADANNEGHVDYEEFIKTISTPLPPDQYGKPPKKRPPPQVSEIQPAGGGTLMTHSASKAPAERESTSAVSDAPAGGESSVHHSDDKSGQGSRKSSAKGSATSSGKGSAETSKKSSRKSSTVAESHNAVVASYSGPPVEAVMHHAPALKHDGHVAKKNDGRVTKKNDGRETKK